MEMPAGTDLGDTLFPAEMHARMAAEYEAQAAALAIELMNTRDGKARAVLAAREEQRTRNALFHRRLAEKAVARRNGANNPALKELTTAA